MDHSSINNFDFSLICEYFSSTDRQGPGSEASTLRALSFLTHLPHGARIADIGCGTGSSALTLARHTDAEITAIDLFPLFVERLQQRAAANGVADRIHALTGDMGALPFDADTFDAVWSEGAICNIGFARGMQLWYPLIREGGYIAVTNASWLTPSRPAEIEEFWQDAYPTIGTVAENTDRMVQAGFRPVATFVLPHACWTEHFYQPQRQAQTLFLQRHPGNATAQMLVENQQREARLYDQYHQYYGYVFYIGRKA